MHQTIINLTKAQDKQLGDLQHECVQVVGYYWGPGHLRVFPLPQKQADQFAKLLQRYKEESEKEDGYETGEWRKIHDATIQTPI